MKSRIIETPKEKTEKPFPKLMECEELVVLFTCETKGTVLIGDHNHKIGYHGTDFGIGAFRDFDQSVILSND